jgi:hypothetical protein
MIVDRLKADIQTSSGLGDALTATEYGALQSLLANPANQPYLFMGCHGPDPMFFNTKDLSPILGKFVELHNDLVDFLRDFEEMLLSAVPQPVLDALAAFEEAANEVIQDSALLSEIQQTFEDLNNLLTAFASLLTEALKAFVSEFNLFDLIEHPYRDGASEGEWWWFDAMHYRKTGKFAEAMLEETRDLTSPNHLYALGYLTHVAADTVGHAYVNLYCGGAYRSHGQRHKTGENFQDVFNLLGVNVSGGITNSDFNYSKLHALYNFNYTGTISDTEPAEDPTLPSGLASFIADTLNRIYQEDPDPDPDYAKRITASDVDDTYRLWYRFMKGFTESGTLPPPVAYSLTAELREVWEKTMDNLGDVGDFLEDAVDSASDFGILSIFVILAALVAAAVLAAAAIADGIAGAVATLGTSTIRYAACLIYEQVYNAFQNFRLAIALNGLAFPMREHLGDPRFRQFITPAFPDSTGVDASDVAGFEPLLRFDTPSILSDPLAAIFNQERHLIYPLTDGERLATRPAPPSYFSTLPTHYAFGRIPLDDDLIGQLVDLQAGQNRSEVDLTTLLQERTLGNALELSGALYDRWFRGERLPDFNLDSDRGYAYLCWTQAGDPPNEPTDLDTNTPSNPQAQVQLEVLP